MRVINDLMHNPDFVARGPVTVNPRRIISSALASPMILGKRCVPPPGKMPIRVSSRPMP